MRNIDSEVVREVGRRRVQIILEHMRGPMVSFVLHVLLLTFLSSLIVREAPKEYDDIDIRQIEIDLSSPVEIPPPPEIDEPDLKDEPTFDSSADVPADDPMDSVDSDFTENSFEEVPVPEIIPPMSFNDSAKTIRVLVPEVMGVRSGKARAETGKKHTRNWAPTQRALKRGLDWLASHQNDDGSWGDSAKGNMSAYTGLAILAFLGHGEDTSSIRYGPTVLRGLKRLLGYLGEKGAGVRGGYRHAIVLYAISEAYAMTKIPMLQNAMDNGMRKLIAGENSVGSFNYGYNNAFDAKIGGPRSDLSVAGWNYQAMKAAFSAGCSTNGFENAYDKAIALGLKKTHFAKTGFRYGAKGGPSPSMTAVGTLCLQLMGEGRSKEVGAGVKYLERPSESIFRWKPAKGGRVKPWSLYQWYYQTQVFFQAYLGKGGKWRKFDKMFSKELVRNQKRDGRWESPAFEHGYAKSGGENSLKGIDQPVYSTAMCCLMLEVYYRYLTTFKVAKLAVRKNGGDDDDLGLRLQ